MNIFVKVSLIKHIKGDFENQSAIINILIEEPTATQKRIARLSGKSERTIKRG